MFDSLVCLLLEGPLDLDVASAEFARFCHLRLCPRGVNQEAEGDGRGGASLSETLPISGPPSVG
jgi:hypothetical protein